LYATALVLVMAVLCLEVTTTAASPASSGASASTPSSRRFESPVCIGGMIAVNQPTGGIS
jgi:hypothetical protein